MKKLLSVAVMMICYMPLTVLGQSGSNTNAVADASIDYHSEQVISLSQEILDLFGYPCKRTGTIDKDTRKQLIHFQKDHHLPETGDVDATTYASLSYALNHPATFAQINSNHGFPKWATTVCLVEKNQNGDVPDGASDTTASSFFILGTTSNNGIKTIDYQVGRPSPKLEWNRLQSTFDSVNFSTFFDLGKPDASYALLNIDWTKNGQFQMSFRHTVTNQPIFFSSGHCHPITK